MHAVLLLVLAGCTPEEPTPEPTGVRFGFPLPERDRFDNRVGVDHDPTVHDDSLAGRAQCWDYLGRPFPNCYDEHDGSDFLLAGGFDAMDAGSSPIVAAADGVVVETDDGNYDRCHADLDAGGTSCDGHPMAANYVIVEHEGGVRSMYWHMKQDSVAVAVGDEVGCGEVLGLVGSSGNSSTPHLHFQLEDADGVPFDPYAGPESQPESWWEEQGGPDELPGAGCTEG